MVFKPLFLLLPYTFFLEKMSNNQILNLSLNSEIFRGGQQFSEFHHTKLKFKILTVFTVQGVAQWAKRLENQKPAFLKGDTFGSDLSHNLAVEFSPS
ncbi:MAG: hypothetical protein IV298_14915 [Cylindrospermopsis raciborskii KL1]|nr:hypothetical protein [Cylindrospermopsis raciborskii KL1]